MPARSGRRADPFGVEGWDDGGFEYVKPDPNSPLNERGGPYFSPPISSHAKPSRDRRSHYDSSPLPRPPVGRDRDREPALRPRDSAELLRDSQARAPPRARRRRSPSPPRPFQPQRDRAYRPPSPPLSGSSAAGGRRFSRSPSPPRRRAAPRDRHPPRATHGRPPMESYTTAAAPPPPPSGPYGASFSGRRESPPRRRYSFDAGGGGGARSGPHRDVSPPPRARRAPRSRDASPVRGARPPLQRSNTTGAARPPPAPAGAGAASKLASATKNINRERWSKAAMAALQAGGMAALQARSDKGAWAGPKGARVGMAALGAAIPTWRAGGGSGGAAKESSGSGGGRRASVSGGGGGGGGAGFRSSGKNTAGEAFGSALGGFLADGLQRSGSSRKGRH